MVMAYEPHLEVGVVVTPALLNTGPHRWQKGMITKSMASYWKAATTIMLHYI